MEQGEHTNWQMHPTSCCNVCSVVMFATVFVTNLQWPLTGFNSLCCEPLTVYLESS